MKAKNTIILLLISWASILQARSQNMNSPYSVYGIGDIDNRSYNRTSGMAGTGLALTSSFYMIDNNPAAITGLTRSFYIIDIAGVGKSVQYKGDPITVDNSSSKDFWIKRFGIAIKINKSWASSVGIKQFSDVNYKFNGSKPAEGIAANYATSYQGDGGLNEYYWTNAFSPGKHFSLGLRSSVIAGGINQTEIVNDATLQSTISTTQRDYYGRLRFQAGALYSTALNKNWDLSLGGRFSPKTKMIAERTVTVAQDGTTLSEDDFLSNNRFYLPTSWAAGIAIKHNKKTTFAVDYTYEDWSSLHIENQSWQLISTQKLSGGIEFSRQKTILNQVFEKKYFQLGAFMGNSYWQIRNQPIREFGFTAGMGGILNSSLFYTVAAEAGSRGTTQANLIKENYVQLTFGLSFRDFLFSKGRKFN